jgi:hypothetical protein
MQHGSVIPRRSECDKDYLLAIRAEVRLGYEPLAVVTLPETVKLADLVPEL